MPLFFCTSLVTIITFLDSLLTSSFSPSLKLSNGVILLDSLISGLDKFKKKPD